MGMQQTLRYTENVTPPSKDHIGCAAEACDVAKVVLERFKRELP